MPIPRGINTLKIFKRSAVFEPPENKILIDEIEKIIKGYKPSRSRTNEPLIPGIIRAAAAIIPAKKIKIINRKLTLFIASSGSEMDTPFNSDIIISIRKGMTINKISLIFSL